MRHYIHQKTPQETHILSHSCCTTCNKVPLVWTRVCSANLELVLLYFCCFVESVNVSTYQIWDLRPQLRSVLTQIKACWCFNPCPGKLANVLEQWRKNLAQRNAADFCRANARLHFANWNWLSTRSGRGIGSSLIWRSSENHFGDNAGLQPPGHLGDHLLGPWAGATLGRYAVLTKQKTQTDKKAKKKTTFL